VPPAHEGFEVDDEGNSATWGAHLPDEEYGALTSLAIEDA